MEIEQIVSFINESINYKKYQEVLTLSRYYFLSCIFELPNRDILFYKQKELFSPIGLLHINIQDIQNNNIDLDFKLKQRKALNQFYSKNIGVNVEADFINLFVKLRQNDFDLMTQIAASATELNINKDIIKSIVLAEVDQLLRIFKYLDSPEKVYADFLNNINIIESAGLTNNNIKFALCNFVSKYLEDLFPNEFYNLNNSTTLTGLYYGINTLNIKVKLDYYRSILNNKNHLVETLKYLSTLHSTNPNTFKILFFILSDFNKRDLDFLINFSHLVFENKNPDIDLKAISQLKDSTEIYTQLDNFRTNFIGDPKTKEFIDAQITQFFNLSYKYQIDFFEPLDSYDFSILEFLSKAYYIIDILYSVYETDIMMEITEDNYLSIAKRIENKSKAIIESLSNSISNPMNFEIYNLNRVNTILNKIFELRSVVKTPKDSDGFILNLVTLCQHYDVITDMDQTYSALLEVETSNTKEVINLVSKLNTELVNYYKDIINQIYSETQNFSLFDASKNGIVDEQNLEIATNVKILIENLRMLGFNNVFLNEKENYLEYREDLLTEYLNGAQID